MSGFPVNLQQSRAMLVPSELPPYQMWALYRRLDVGGIVHAEYVGILERRDGETADELTARAEARLAGRE